VIGYPNEENYYVEQNYPQVSMFAGINKFDFKEKGKIIRYHEIQTSIG
jgi:hypothetical protein